MSDTIGRGGDRCMVEKVGGIAVKLWDILAEVETDKSKRWSSNPMMKVCFIYWVKEKDSFPVNGIIACIGEKGEKVMEEICLFKGKKKKPFFPQKKEIFFPFKQVLSPKRKLQPKEVKES